jgi:hypothetical protein
MPRDRERRLRALAEVRDPIYETLADILFPGHSRSIRLAAERLSQAILSYWDAPDPPGDAPT